MTVRLTARSRLALLYTALVLAAGVMLTALTYVLVRNSLANRWVVIKTGPSDHPSPIPLNNPAVSTIAEQVRTQTLTELLTQSALALAIVALLATLLGWLVAGRILRPIRAISATARRLSAENLSERVPSNTPADELAALADTINAMLDRIQSGVADRDRLLDGQRMFVANAAHELRTPLTTMRTAIDVTLDGQPSTDELLAMVRDISTAIDRSQRTLDGLLTLARSQTGPSRRHAADLADLAAGTVDSVSKQITAHHLTLRTDLQPAPTSGEPVLLDRMVSNLLDNAIRHNHPGGWITVTTGTAQTQAFLQVVNTGQPIDPDQVETLFEPFVRVPASPTQTDTGLGLGLSIVRAVAVAHHGTVSGTAHPTGGLDITVAVPLIRSSLDAVDKTGRRAAG